MGHRRRRGKGGPRRNIYQGPDSCYAVAEGLWAPGSGVNLETGVSILSLILRDLERGWTYDHSCRRVRMTEALARRRAIYLYALCRKHHDNPSDCYKLKAAVMDALAHGEIPGAYRGLVRLVERKKKLMPAAAPVRVVTISRARRRAAAAR